MVKSKLLHILEAQQFDRSWIEKTLFPEAEKLRKQFFRGKVKPILKGKSVCLLFYEPSTRTRLSFQNAALLLGANVAATENAKEFSSAVKGESLSDTIKVVHSLGYSAIVIRSDVEGGAREAASVSKIPILNAGDAGGQHPTQALLDLFTLYKHFGKLDGLTISFVGDLSHSRSTNSLSYLLSKFKRNKIIFVSPKKFKARIDLKDYLIGKGVQIEEVTKISDAIEKSDMVYLTRPQKERFKKGETFGSGFKDYMIDLKMLEKLPKKSIVMDPLPRVGELPEEVDIDKRVVIFDQVQNGLFVRMALLKLVLT